MTMRKLSLLVIPLLFVTTFESNAQSNNIAQIWEMVPIFGHAGMVEDALKEHVLWRNAHGDTWNWDVFQVVTGENYNTFYARSGSHTWADFDSYNLEGASEHFQATVQPHLQSVSNSISAGDTTNVYFPPDGEFNLLTVVSYDVIGSKRVALTDALGKFSEALRKRGTSFYHVFSWTVAGGDGTNDLTGVFPADTWADFEDPDPNIMQIMMEEYGEEAMGIFEAFTSAVRNERTMILVHRKDLSSDTVE